MAKIFCFSSTGNSLYVAKMLAKKLDAKVISMSNPSMSCDDSIIGFVFPVYFWEPPKIVKKYIENLIITNKNVYIFTVITYGGKVYGVQGTLNKLLKKKGLSLQYGKNIKCVENYIPVYKVNNNKEIHLMVNQKIDTIVNDINEKTQSKIETHTFVNQLIYKFFPGKKDDCDKKLTVSSRCTGCGICQKVCPVENITLENKKPVFLHNCEHCLACVHACPLYCIDWKQSTQGKERYLNPHIKLNELISFNSKE